MKLEIFQDVENWQRVHIVLDGVELSQRVRRAEIDLNAGERPVVRLTLLPDELTLGMPELPEINIVKDGDEDGPV